jgi:hypothetical protein
MSNEITKQILEEMLDLSVKVIRYAESQKVNRSIQDQLIRAITSIGANYSEAQDASSKKDFLNKIYIAKKEASESIYSAPQNTGLQSGDVRCRLYGKTKSCLSIRK